MPRLNAKPTHQRVGFFITVKHIAQQMARFLTDLRNAFAIRLQYTQREANGALALLCICSVCMALPYGVRQYILATTTWSDAHELAFTITRLDSASEREYGAKFAKNRAENDQNGVDFTPNGSENEPKRSKIDLNEATSEELVTRGLPDWLAERVVKYRNHGGHFKAPEDLQKIYGVKPFHLAKVLPYLSVKTKGTDYSTRAAYVSNAHTKSVKQALLDVNTSDSATLVAIKGIGPYTASSIVKYRRLLGGFISTKQLYELYNQDSARTAAFLPQLFVADGFTPAPFRINQLETDNLYHPYLPKPSVRILKAYIRQHGPMADLQDLVNARLMTAAEFARLKPYLSLD